jgi:hypothetical protein
MAENSEATNQLSPTQILAAASQVEAPDVGDPERLELLRINDSAYLLRVIDVDGDVSSVQVAL